MTCTCFHSGAPNEDAYARGAAELTDSARARLREVGLGELVLERGRRPPRKPALAVERLIAAYSTALVDQASRKPGDRLRWMPIS